ncbi:MAG: divalent-cation tolerance protein CutA [Bacteroidota bacterium]
MNSLIFVYITAKNKSEAKKIGRILLEEHLAACINIFDNMTSLYWWENKIQHDKEVVLIAKTTKKLFPALSKKVKSIHSYSCPCILQLPVTCGNKEYEEWLLSNIRNRF